MVVLLEGLGFYVHGFGLGFAFFENDFGFGFALGANRRRMAFGFGDQALLFGGGEGFDPLTFDLSLFQHSRDQFFFAAIDFRFLHFDLLFLFDLHDLHLLSDDLLLHDVGLDVVGLVGFCLLLLGYFEILRFLDFKVALGFSLLGLGDCFRQHALLVGLRSSYCRFASCDGAPDGGVAIRF